jgi:hypothetical protein
MPGSGGPQRIKHAPKDSHADDTRIPGTPAYNDAEAARVRVSDLQTTACR